MTLRLVAVADTHLFTDGYPVPDGDLFIHAGDLCRRGDLDDLERAAAWLKALPHRHKIVVAGNHDWAFQRSPKAARELLGPGVIYLHDSGAEVEGLRFWGSPWQPEFMSWAFNLPRGEPLAAKWALIPEGTDVLITHGPPAGLGDNAGMIERVGCSDLLARVQALKPALHLYGHIHEDGGLWERDGVTYANVTTWECDRPPTVIDLDPEGIPHPISVPVARR